MFKLVITGSFQFCREDARLQRKHNELWKSHKSPDFTPIEFPWLADFRRFRVVRQSEDQVQKCGRQ
jgi:hypothetical protein